MTNIFPEIGATDDPFKQISVPLTIPQFRGVKLNYLADVISAMFQVSVKDIMARDRRQNVAFARHFLCYIAAKQYNYSGSEIGRQLKRDHTTILHSIKKIEDCVEGGSPEWIVNAVNSIVRKIDKDSGYFDRMYGGDV